MNSTYSVLGWSCISLGGVLLLLAIVLFFKWDILDVLDTVSGAKRNRAISRMRDGDYQDINLSNALRTSTLMLKDRSKEEKRKKKRNKKKSKQSKSDIVLDNVAKDSTPNSKALTDLLDDELAKVNKMLSDTTDSGLIEDENDSTMLLGDDDVDVEKLLEGISSNEEVLSPSNETNNSKTGIDSSTIGVQTSENSSDKDKTLVPLMSNGTDVTEILKNKANGINSNLTTSKDELVLDTKENAESNSSLEDELIEQFGDLTEIIDDVDTQEVVPTHTNDDDISDLTEIMEVQDKGYSVNTQDLDDKTELLIEVDTQENDKTEILSENHDIFGSKQISMVTDDLDKTDNLDAVTAKRSKVTILSVD